MFQKQTRSMPCTNLIFPLFFISVLILIQDNMHFLWMQESRQCTFYDNTESLSVTFY